jgi:hypothetical protein
MTVKIITSDFEKPHYVETGTETAVLIVHPKDLSVTLRVTADDGVLLNARVVRSHWSDWRAVREAIAIAVGRGYSDLSVEWADGTPFA